MNLSAILGRVDTAIAADNDQTTIPVRPCLNTAADRIADAQNYVVHCEAELERARMQLTDAQRAFVEILQDRHLGLEKLE